MEKCLNKTMLIGRLGKDPETRYTGNGTAVTSVSIATSDYWKDAEDRPQERTDWHDLVIWGKKGEVFAQYAKRGSRVFIEGKTQKREYTDNNNQKRFAVEVNVQDFTFLDSKPGSGSGTQAPAQAQAPTRATVQDPVDDLPF